VAVAAADATSGSEPTVTTYEVFREVVITLHCTLDTDHAVVEDLSPSPL